MKIGKGDVAVVTGGASGLGRELCLLLAERGANLWITDLSQAAAQKTADDCVARGAVGARAIACDVSKAAGVGALRDRVMKESGRVDFLVNNAGVAVGGD